MRINISKSKNHEFIYIIRDIYNNGSRTTKIYQKLGIKVKIRLPKLLQISGYTLYQFR